MRSNVWLVPVGMAMAGGVLQAGIDSWGEQPNRFSVSARGGFNIEANFKNLGGYPARTEIGSPQGGQNHEYDDGFNRVDSTGGTSGTTSNWGYERSSQLVSTNQIAFSSYSAQGQGAREGVTDDPHGSIEVSWARELGWNGSYWYGVVAAVSWTDLSFEESATFASDATRTEDIYEYAYDANDPLPAAPYQGSFTGGRRIGDQPLRSTHSMPGGAVTEGRYEFNGDGYGARLGLLFETPFADWFDLQFGGGFACMYVQSEFGLQETTTIESSGTQTRAASNDDSGFVLGGYAEVGFSLRLSQHFNLTAGAQYFYLTEYEHELGPEAAELKMENSVFGVLGLTYTF